MQPNLAFLPAPIPIWLSVCFALLVVLLLVGMYFITGSVSKKTALSFLFGSIVWLGFLHLLAQKSFFLNTTSVPPRFLVVVIPPLFFTVGLFMLERGRGFIDGLSIRQLTWVHTIRIGVELLLLQLFIIGQIPEVMTFEGRNWDILAGLTAPFMVFYQKKCPPKILLWWNIAALALLVNIVTTAVLSAPFPFQQLAFEQPNVGVLKPSFIWLPGFVVPVVLFCHLVVIRRLWLNKD